MGRGIYVEENEETGESTTYLIDEMGRRINEMGQLVDEMGMPVNGDGFRLNMDNMPLDADGNPLPSVGDDPIRIDDMGRRINADNHADRRHGAGCINEDAHAGECGRAY